MRVIIKLKLAVLRKLTKILSPKKHNWATLTELSNIYICRKELTYYTNSRKPNCIGCGVKVKAELNWHDFYTYSSACDYLDKEA